jgi:hypothetical protein
MGSRDPPRIGSAHGRSAHGRKLPCADGSGPAGVPQTEDKGEDRKEEDEQDHAENDNRQHQERQQITHCKPPRVTPSRSRAGTSKVPLAPRNVCARCFIFYGRAAFKCRVDEARVGVSNRALRLAALEARRRSAVTKGAGHPASGKAVGGVAKAARAAQTPDGLLIRSTNRPERASTEPAVSRADRRDR